MTFYSMKDIAITIQELAEAKGLEYDMLAEKFDELAAKTGSAEKAFQYLLQLTAFLPDTSR